MVSHETNAPLGLKSDVPEPHGSRVNPSSRHVRSNTLRRVGYVLLCVATAWFVWTKRADLPATRDALQAASPFWMFVAFVLALVFMVNQAMFYRSAQRALGVELPPRDVWNGSNAAFFVNTIAKSGGLAGVTAFTAAASRHRLSRSRTIAAYVVVAVLGQLGFALSLIVSIVVLAGSGHFTRIEMIASVVFGLYTIVLTVSVAAGFRSRRLLRSIHALPTRIKHSVRRISDSDPSVAAVDTTEPDELFDALQLLRQDPRALTVTFLHAILVEVLAVAMLWATLHAVGAGFDPSVALVAYSISVMFFIVGVLPGGLGFVEASLGVVLSGYGVSVAAVAASVVLYRLLELWLPLAVGAVAVRKMRSQ